MRPAFLFVSDDGRDEGGPDATPLKRRIQRKGANDAGAGLAVEQAAVAVVSRNKADDLAILLSEERDRAGSGEAVASGVI